MTAILESKFHGKNDPDITFIIKTMCRPNSLRMLLNGINIYFPYEQALVLDDSNNPYPEIAEQFKADSIVFTPDLGIGACINTSIKEHLIKGKWAILMEDDFFISERSNIFKLIIAIQKENIDILGGAVKNTKNNSYSGFIGNFDWTEFPVHPGPYIFHEHSHIHEIRKFDVIPNFWITETINLDDLLFCEELKVARHIDWFLRARGFRPRQGPKPVSKEYIVGYCPFVEILHTKEQHEEWDNISERKEKRWSRMESFRKRFMNIWGFEEAEGVKAPT